MAGIKIDPEMLDIYMESLNKLMAGSETDGGNARLEVSGAGKTEDGLVRYNEEVNKLGDDLRELYGNEGEILGRIRDGTLFKNADKVSVVARSTDGAGVLAKHADEAGAWLHGVKVFRYSDETAEAVASGEKLLKESGTIYESFADMMSPEDAKRYLDFLENGSREGLTGAELAGVEKADALLVSQKVGYEDVWDLRNAGDALESGRESSIMDYSNRFADSLAEDFNPGVEVRDVVKEDMILVQFSSDAPNASLRYWTTIDEANGISTIEEYMDKMALSKEWGNRNVVKVARVKKKTEVTHAIGTAKAQTKISDPRPGNGKQILFSKFDSNWITEVRNIKE